MKRFDTWIHGLAYKLPGPLLRPIRSAYRRVRGVAELKMLGLMCDPGRIALDIGANVGEFTPFLAEHSRACIAFEPNPQLASRIAEENIGRNVRVEACALSDEEGPIDLAIPVRYGQEFTGMATIESDNRIAEDSVRRVTVPRRRLDDFGLEPTAALKIDVEGHEQAVLRGASRLIERDRPSVLIELQDSYKPGTTAAVARYFADRGYRGYFLLRRRVLPISEFDPARHQNPEDLQFGYVTPGREYATNFAFLADPSRIERLDRLVRRRGSL